MTESRAATEVVAARRAQLHLPPLFPRGGRPPHAEVSPSKIKHLDTCRYSYKLKYIDRVKLSTGDHEVQALGKVVHRALETLAEARMTLGGDDPQGEVTFKQLRFELEQAAAMHKVEPHAFRRAYDLLKGCRSRLDFSRTVAIEEPWGWTIPDLTPEAKVVGVFDRIDWEPTTRELVVWDYKSGAYLPTTAEFESDPQVTLYLAVAKQLFGHANPSRIRAKFWYLGTAEHPLTLDWTPEIDEHAWAYARTFVRTIRGKDTEWRARTGPHCVRCDYRVECPAYQRLARSEGAVEHAAEGGDEELLRERHRCHTLAKLFADHKEALDQIIERRIEARGGQLLGGGFRAKLIAPERTRLPDVSFAARLLADKLRQLGVQGERFTETAIALDLVADQGLTNKRLAAWLDQHGFRADVKHDLEAAIEEVSVPFNSYSYVDVKSIGGPF